MNSGFELGPFLLAFASALLAARLLGELAERVGQPSVLGELSAGVLLGPSALGLVPLTDSVALVAEIGVVLLLFEVGLETELGELLRVGLPAAAVAVVGMAAPFAGGYTLTRGLGYPPLTAIFAGAALTATSIGITARVLSELRLLRGREGQIVLGAAVIDDVLGLVLLAIVAKVGTGGGLAVSAPLWSGLSAVGFVVGAIAVGIPIARRLVGIVGRANVRGVLVSAAVAFALLAAWAAEKARSAPIIGAFAAGMALARTNRRHEIDEALKPIVDVVSPVFFVWVGAQLDVSVLDPLRPANRSGLLLGAGLAAVGFLGKFLAGFCAWGRVRRALIGAGMVPRGEVGLIFASMGASTGALPHEAFAAVLLAVFATTFVAPPLLRAFAPRR